MESEHSTLSRSRMPTAGAPTRVDIVLSNGFALHDVAAIIEIFHKASALTTARPSGEARYDVSLVSAAGGRIAASSSVFVWTESIDSRRRVEGKQIMFVAGGAAADPACRDKRLIDWLRRQHPLCETVHPIADGKLLLDAAGLPSGFRAANDTPDMQAARSPGGEPDAIRIALRVVEDDLGGELARQVSGSLAMPAPAPSDAFVAASNAPRVSEQITASARWLEANVDRPVSIDAAAQVAAMSARNFLRRFKSEIGMTPSDYLQRARLNMSCRMLVESSLPVDKVARRCGINSGAQLARLFRKYLSTTPTEYRMRNDATTGMA
ncbi:MULTISPECIES: helix-turn-helix domain-containing protein [unclassified Burkholderia]|uniref:helix-turn-helix domain-containing protein n=1 Tax=unclassified Burkholderia TaxID=2613784 RepID=UPI000F57975D|nr:MULTISPECIES: helix-turn-helix domain-containing protein [unclassified Burkholderia]RQR40043.1 helix-turn-helix domain-containing protein [Burkholderia sp. Bp9131]RQR68320.1 helix-turn-helix domain-containing protein [Burkholderia sp. Bp9015]RQR96443.1 helix-turn-helix domain-containing protein [Burkholderia sp. Bp8994]RQS25813.1 helix-turn-helix domain-containing protein [Burkholderia sp. Bp8995]RQS44278.1 helix-turn-helix domain-containing protein [Burkholderia sp. Bp8989]